VIAADDEARLPFREASFDLVVSRHPTVAVWPEIARVLRPGGTYLSQQVGAGSNRELTDFMMGPQLVSRARSPQRAVAGARAAGLTVVDLGGTWGSSTTWARCPLPSQGPWTVPRFTVDGE
jgi:SAM-dependent methyltransferase